MGPFLAQGHNLNNLGRETLDDTKYKILKLLALWFLRRRFLKFPFLKSIFSSRDLLIQWTWTIWIILVEDHLRTIHAKFGHFPTSCFREEVVWWNLKVFFYIFHIWKTDSAPWRPCFLRYHHYLYKLDRQLIEEHFYEKSFEIHPLDSEKKIF